MVQQIIPRTTNPRFPQFIIKWKGDRKYCDSNNSYNCSRGQTTTSIVPKWSRPFCSIEHPVIIKSHDSSRDSKYYPSNGPEFKPRPIKHWRKRLIPRETTGYSTTSSTMAMDIPGGSSRITSDSEGCNKESSKINTYISKLPVVSSTANDFLDISVNCNQDDPVFHKPMCCNPENNVIKSGVTLLNKNYYSDSIGYLKARCKTYEQRLSGTKLPNVDYFNKSGKYLWPNNNIVGPQSRAMKNCYKSCVDTSATGCPGPDKSIIATTIYKPNNQQFAVQGAVSSSTRLDRLKLNTINKAAHNQLNAWGAQSANASTYNGTFNAPYTIKSKYNSNTQKHNNRNIKNICC